MTDRDQQIRDHTELNLLNSLTFRGLQVMITNAFLIAEERKIKKIGACDPAEWRDLNLVRVGREPVARLIFGILRDINHAKIGVCELLAEDPALMAKCLDSGNISPYYAKFPTPQQTRHEN